MAKIKHAPHIEEMIGEHSKGGIRERRKHFRDFDGNVIRVGRLEAFQQRPRNYASAPILIRERANMTAFGDASHLAKELIDAAKNKTPLPAEKQALLDSILERFKAQLTGTPDPIAPKDKDGNYTIYSRPDNFIRAVIRVEKPQILSA